MCTQNNKKSVVFTEQNTYTEICKMRPILDRLFLSHTQVVCLQVNLVDLIFSLAESMRAVFCWLLLFGITFSR